MALRSFSFCTLQFLNLWLEKESHYCESLASEYVETQRDALVAAAGYFGITRNLPKRYETQNNIQRYQPILHVLSELDGVSSLNVVDLVSDVQENISVQYGDRKVLSLVTKFLWLKYKSPVRIYDKQTQIALGTANGDFPAFNNAFSVRYDGCRDQIEEACRDLKNAMAYSVQPKMNHRELEFLTSELWFRERVLHLYLWNQGDT